MELFELWAGIEEITASEEMAGRDGSRYCRSHIIQAIIRDIIKIPAEGHFSILSLKNG